MPQIKFWFRDSAHDTTKSFVFTLKRVYIYFQYENQLLRTRTALAAYYQIDSAAIYLLDPACRGPVSGLKRGTACARLAISGAGAPTNGAYHISAPLPGCPIAGPFQNERKRPFCSRMPPKNESAFVQRERSGRMKRHPTTGCLISSSVARTAAKGGRTGLLWPGTPHHSRARSHRAPFHSALAASSYARP